MDKNAGRREPVTVTRKVALDVLRSAREGKLADRALDTLGRELDLRDHAWTQELVYGTLRLRGRIDHLIRQLIRNGEDRLEDDVRDVLRLGAYQLLEMGSVPPYAAISQSVELVRWAGNGRASGLVNGVLQSLRRQGDRLSFPTMESDPIEALCTWGSHPRWLVERWVARWGVESTARLVEANNRRPDLYLRLVGVEKEAAMERLIAGGVEVEDVPFATHSLRVLTLGAARDALGLVPAVVQDPAAALVVDFADVREGATLLDLCAAPGGKAIAAADRGRYVIAADLSYRRQRRLRENVDRLEFRGRVGTVVADARTPPFRPVETVLLDAPCTGTGTLRRHPDGRWRLSPEDLRSVVELQRELLDTAATLVAPNGALVYSTCSLEPEENEEQIAAFLRRSPEFARERTGGIVEPGLLTDEGDLMVLPQSLGVDGAYAAKLRRAA